MNGIVVHQGKSERFILQLVTHGEDIYEPGGTIYEPDGTIVKVVFGVKSGEFGEFLINKELEYDSEQLGYLLELTPEETDLPEETYSYDFSYYDDSGGFYIAAYGNFIVLRGVTKYEEE